MKKIILLFSIFILIYLVLTILFTEYHEETHLEIDKIYGCSGSYIKYSFLHLSGEEYSGSCKAETDLERNRLHSQNEIFGYNVRIIYLSILFIGLLISISLIISKTK